MTNKQPFFSVIVPVYNVYDYLPECLDSLLNQTFSDFEIIIVDDCSTDNSVALAKQYVQRYPDRILLIEHTVNKGLGGARNSGIEAASGQYLEFMDSDDYLKSHTLETLYNRICQTGADIVGFDFSWVSENGSFLRYEQGFREEQTLLAQNFYPLCYTVSACNKVFRKTLFLENHIRFPEKRYYEDYWTTPKLLLMAKSAAYCNEAFYCYRQRGTSIMHDTNVSKAEDIMAGTDQLIDFCRQAMLPSARILEIEALAIEHVLINATLRVNSIDAASDMQQRLFIYMQDRFPYYRNNPYQHLISRKFRRLQKLIERKQYTLLNLCFYRRNKITGSIKQFLRTVIK